MKTLIDLICHKDLPLYGVGFGIIAGASYLIITALGYNQKPIHVMELDPARYRTQDSLFITNIQDMHREIDADDLVLSACCVQARACDSLITSVINRYEGRVRNLDSLRRSITP